MWPNNFYDSFVQNILFYMYVMNRMFYFERYSVFYFERLCTLQGDTVLQKVKSQNERCDFPIP